MLDAHELGNGHAAVPADPAHVVAAEVHEHEVLGALLLVAEQLALEVGVAPSVAARTRARDRPHLNAPPFHALVREKFDLPGDVGGAV